MNVVIDIKCSQTLDMKLLFKKNIYIYNKLVNNL